MTAMLSFFLKPWMLAILPLGLAVLIYVYRKRGQGEKILVASTLLLKLLASQPTSPTRFKPPLRFFLELLILILLTLASANLYLNPAKLKVAIVIDNSFNSFARTTTGTRLIAMQEQVQSLLTTMPLNAAIDIFSAAPHLTKLNQTATIAGTSGMLLADLRPAFAAADLNATLRSLASLDYYDEVHVITLAASDRLANNSVKLHSIQGILPATNNNIAISQVIYKASSEKQPTSSLLATIRSFADSNTSFTLTGTCFDNLGNWIKLSSKNVNLSANAELTEALIIGQSNFIACKVELIFNAENIKRDLLTEDNQAWVDISGDNGSILYVGPLSSEATGLGNIPFYNFKYTKPENYNAEESRISKATIFHRFAPDIMPTNSWFLLAPGQQSSLYVTANEEVQQITNWKKDHQILRYVQLNLLKPGRLQGYENIAGYKSLITSGSKAVFLINQSVGSRQIISGIELLPFTSDENTTLSILLLNSLKWLHSFSNETSNIVALHSSATQFEELKYVDTYNNLGVLDNAATISYPGLIRIKKAQQTSYVAINYFDVDQSNLNHRPIITPEYKNTKTESLVSSEIKSWLLFVAILLVLIDLFVCLFLSRKRTRVLKVTT